MTTAEMIKSHPDLALDPDALVTCIDAARQAQTAAIACADADLAEDVAAMRTCIRRCLDAADVASTTAAVLSRQVAMDLGLVRVVLEACAVAAKRCAVECELHADMHEHCRVCAQACGDLYAASRTLLETLRDEGVPQPDER
jgi:hypothetical protein